MFRTLNNWMMEFNPDHSCSVYPLLHDYQQNIIQLCQIRRTWMPSHRSLSANLPIVRSLLQLRRPGKLCPDKFDHFLCRPQLFLSLYRIMCIIYGTNKTFNFPIYLSSTLAVTACPKPHKWGDKNFFLSGTSGFSYDFDLYAGSQSNSVPPGAPDLGMSSKMVVKLSESIPKHQNYKLFFDNWFSSVPLMVYLTKEGILSLGRVRLNLVLGADMPKE
nr:unnamed protein product [Callosobruchus chinensis]